jgi:hypothetical protein
MHERRQFLQTGDHQRVRCRYCRRPVIVIVVVIVIVIVVVVVVVVAVGRMGPVLAEVAVH